MMGARIINRRPVVLNAQEESVQEKSWREWQENFARVSADPESASITDLMRAIGYLDKVRSSIQRHAWEQGRKVDANVIAGYENEEQYYQRLIEQKQGRRRNAPRVTQRDVDAAAQTYHNNMMAYGENNMATQRAEWKYRELQRTYNEQKAKRKERAENPAWFGYHPRFVPEHLWNELVNLWHLSRVPFSGVREGARYKRMIWTSGEFHKEHPEISSTAAYKDLDGFLAYSGK